MMTLSVIVVTVAMRCACPARHPSPKNSFAPRIATTASLPCSETTVIFTLPFWMKNTTSAGDPCEKTIWSLRYLPMLRPSPTLARKDFGLNDGRRLIAMTRPSRRKSLKSEPAYYHSFPYDSHEQYRPHCRPAVRDADTDRRR